MKEDTITSLKKDKNKYLFIDYQTLLVIYHVYCTMVMKNLQLTILKI